MLLIHVCLALVALCRTLVNFCCVFIYFFFNMLLNKLARVDLFEALGVTRGEGVKHGTDHPLQHKKKTKMKTFRNC